MDTKIVNSDLIVDHCMWTTMLIMTHIAVHNSSQLLGNGDFIGVGLIVFQGLEEAFDLASFLHERI